MKKSSAKAVPGALEFLLYARAKGVEVFYVSNRKEKYFSETLQNLQKLGFPFALGDHLFLRREEKSKKGRRELVERNTSIVMLIGDNLADFSEVFETQNIEERLAITDRFRDKFGTRFIVLPNAIYGDWLDAIYGDDPEATPEVRAGQRKQALKTE
jgi:5'-nucleotidase (lipoprotein e(P4) family)